MRGVIFERGLYARWSYAWGMGLYTRGVIYERGLYTIVHKGGIGGFLLY